MFRKHNPFASEENTFSWWWFGIKVGVITAFVVLWLLDQQKKKKLAQITNIDSLGEGMAIPLPDEAPSTIEKNSQPQVTPSKPDDLRKIEGIGPKIQATLQAAGIVTFGQLAASKPADLKQILVDAGIRIGYPDTWPEQAELAARNEWDTLAELQGTLQGGRRIS